MAGPPLATDIEVIDAGMQLTKEDRRVTGYSLKLALGGRGDAVRHMRIWNLYLQNNSRGDAAPPTAAPPAVDLPEEIATLYGQLRSGFTESLDNLARSIWSTADRRARVRLDEEVAATQRVQAGFDEEQKTLAELIRLAESHTAEARAAGEAAVAEALAQRQRADVAEAMVAVITQERDRIDGLRLDAERRLAVAEAELSRDWPVTNLSEMEIPPIDQLPTLAEMLAKDRLMENREGSASAADENTVGLDEASAAQTEVAVRRLSSRASAAKAAE